MMGGCLDSIRDDGRLAYKEQARRSLITLNGISIVSPIIIAQK